MEAIDKGFSMRVFLIGGGLSPRGLCQTFGPFVGAARAGGAARIACVLLRSPAQRLAFGFYYAALAALGIARVVPVYVSRKRPLRAADLEGATGVLVCGGLTPAYHAALVPTADEWLPWLRERAIPYAGYSAGAMIAAETAILGGWKLHASGPGLAIGTRAASEGRAYLDCRPGLGLVPFLVESHATQWGTLSRLLHAIEAGHGTEGWAIDEGTLVEVGGGTATVRGLGTAYRVRRSDEGITVDILTAGASCRLRQFAQE
jgi:cyanophycinase